MSFTFWIQRQLKLISTMSRYRGYQPAPNYSSLRQKRGENYLNYVRRSTSSGRLIEPIRLVYDLALLSDGTYHICDAILDQCRLIRDEYDVRWIEKIWNEARNILCTESWVEDNLPSLIRSSNASQEGEHVLLPFHRHHPLCAYIFVFEPIPTWMLCVKMRSSVRLLTPRSLWWR